MDQIQSAAEDMEGDNENDSRGNESEDMSYGQVQASV